VSAVCYVVVVGCRGGQVGGGEVDGIVVYSKRPGRNLASDRLLQSVRRTEGPFQSGACIHLCLCWDDDGDSDGHDVGFVGHGSQSA
jgi:hypothetical protein